MAFSTPLTITINSIAYALNRVNGDNYGSNWVYRDAARSINMDIKHSSDAPNKVSGVVNLRHSITVTHRIYATSTVKELIYKWTYTLVTPDYADPADAQLSFVGMATALTSSTHHTDLLAGLN